MTARQKFSYICFLGGTLNIIPLSTRGILLPHGEMQRDKMYRLFYLLMKIKLIGIYLIPCILYAKLKYIRSSSWHFSIIRQNYIKEAGLHQS
jgi:hypothetical protein